MNAAHLSLTAVVTGLLAAAPLAQNPMFEENFDAGIPTSWSNIQLGYTGDIWMPGFDLIDGTPDVFHEAFCDYGLFFRDNILLSPKINLSGLTDATFDCGQFQKYPLMRLYNGIEVTTDGGVTYTKIYEELGTWDGVGTIQADMSAFAGNPSVQVALHYQGTIANDWSVDNFRVTTTSPVLTVTNLVGGASPTLKVIGGDPGQAVVIAFSVTGSGPTATSLGPVNLSPPKFPITATPECTPIRVMPTVTPISACCSTNARLKASMSMAAATARAR